MVADRIEREEMRSLLLDALARHPGTQYENLKWEVAEVAAARGLPVEPAMPGHYPRLRAADFRRLRELIWALVAEGLVTVGKDDNNAAWPWLSLTEWGEQYVKQGGPPVYDPDGYLRRLAEIAPLDATERRYLTQAPAAFRVGLADAAAVMLGAAAEHRVLQLAEAIQQADPTTGTALTKTRGKVFRLIEFERHYLAERHSRSGSHRVATSRS